MSSLKGTVGQTRTTFTLISNFILLFSLAAEYLNKYRLFVKNPGHTEPASKRRRRDSHSEVKCVLVVFSAVKIMCIFIKLNLIVFLAKLL